MNRNRVLVIVVSSILALIILGGMAYLQVRTRSERILESNEAFYATRTALAIHGPPAPPPPTPIRRWKGAHAGAVHVGMCHWDVVDQWGEPSSKSGAGDYATWEYADATLEFTWQEEWPYPACYKITLIKPR